MTDPVMAMANVTCKTPNCPVQGITYSGVEVQIHSEGQEIRVICAQCGNAPEVTM